MSERWRYFMIVAFMASGFCLTFILNVSPSYEITEIFPSIALLNETPLYFCEFDRKHKEQNCETNVTSVPKRIDTTVEISTTGNRSTFSKLLENFEWGLLEKATRNKNTSQIIISLEALILELSNFLSLEPFVPTNHDCGRPTLLVPENINCSKYPTGFSGNQTPNANVKVGIIIQFGFDVDILEIYLNEVYDVVDQFFIIESTRAHNRGLSKPLMWEKVQFQPRFLKFARKVTHFVIDDSQSERIFARLALNPNSRKNIWLMEQLQDVLRWKKFMEWNNARKLFSDHDILGFGDADEIPSRSMVHLLKFCELKGGKVDFGIWFPFGNIKHAFAPDQPIREHKFTLGNPGFWTLKSSIEFWNSSGRAPSRNHGTSAHYLLGGIHMTHNGYLPFLLVKHITATEGGLFSMKEIRSLSKTITIERLKKLEFKAAAVPKRHRGRLVNLTEIADEMREIAVLPWFYKCNLDRYPAWQGKHDSRLYLPVKSKMNS